MNLSKSTLQLYAITDNAWLNGDSLEHHVEIAVKSGVTMLQMRDYYLSDEQFIAQASKLKIITDKYDIPFIINNNIDVALAINACGVHIGQKDISAIQARKLIGNDKILGISVQTVEQAILAQTQTADYLGVGAVFPTTTKLDAKLVELDTLTQICNSVSIPVVAIGGIGVTNMALLRNSGIAGVAVISAIFSKPDLAQASNELRQMSNKLSNNNGFNNNIIG